LVRQPQKQEFLDVLIPPGGNDTDRYVHRIFFYPDLGKGPIVRRVLEEYVRARQAEGKERARLQQQLFGPSGQAFVLVYGYASLVEYESFLRSVEEPARRTVVAELNALGRAPIRQELLEVLVPLSR
jgi:hypothetical protein